MSRGEGPATGAGLWGPFTRGGQGHGVPCMGEGLWGSCTGGMAGVPVQGGQDGRGGHCMVSSKCIMGNGHMGPPPLRVQNGK